MNSDPVLGHDVLQVHGPSNFRSVGCTISFGILDVTIVRYPKVTVDDVEERILEDKQSDKSCSKQNNKKRTMVAHARLVKN